MGFLNNLFGGGDRPRPPAPSVTPRQLDQAVFLSKTISDLLRETLFDEDIIAATGKPPNAFRGDPYITGFIFGAARETSKSIGPQVGEKDSIVIASGVSKLILGDAIQSTSPNAPSMFERGTVNGSKLARDLNDESGGEFELMQSLWIDYVLYKYATPAFRKSEEFSDIVKAPWFD